MSNVSKLVKALYSFGQAINEVWADLPPICEGFAHGRNLSDLNEGAIKDFCERYGETYAKDIEENCTDEMLEAYLAKFGPVTIKDIYDVHNIRVRAISYAYAELLTSRIIVLFRIVFLERYLDISGVEGCYLLAYVGVDALQAAIEELTPTASDILLERFDEEELLDQLVERVKGMARAS